MDSQQEAGSWDGASGLLVGDFTNRGTEQLLVTFPSEPGIIVSCAAFLDTYMCIHITGESRHVKFCLTDLHQFEVDARMPELSLSVRQTKEHSSPPESLVSALMALHVRKQVRLSNMSSIKVCSSPS